jgi:hypothetical protein
MAVALDASTPAAVFGDTSATTSLTTASFTPPSGSILLAKVWAADGGMTVSTPTATGITFTSRWNIGSNNSTTRLAGFTGTGAAGSAVTVTATFGGLGNARALLVEVWTGAQLAASPAVHTLDGTGGTAASDSLTTVANNSVVSAMVGDWSAIDGTSRTYRSSATETAYHTVTGGYTLYGMYQAAATAGAQTYGLTAPTGMKSSTAVIELQSSGGAPAIPPILIMPTRRA